MKKVIYPALLFTAVSFTLLFFSTKTYSQGPPPPPPAEHGSSSNQGPSDAPIAGGLFILLGLGGIYSGYKGVRFYRKNKKNLLD